MPLSPVNGSQCEGHEPSPDATDSSHWGERIEELAETAVHDWVEKLCQDIPFGPPDSWCDFAGDAAQATWDKIETVEPVPPPPPEWNWNLEST
jgi:hypothetical protein